MEEDEEVRISCFICKGDPDKLFSFLLAGEHEWLCWECLLIMQNTSAVLIKPKQKD